MQAIANFIADLTRISQSQSTTQALNEINVLATRYFRAANQLRSADATLKPYAAILIPHRSRCEEAIARIHEILACREEQWDSEEQESVAMLENMAQDIKSAVITMDDHLRPLQEAVEEANILVDTALRLLLQRLRASAEYINEVDAMVFEARITPEMYLSEDLDTIEQRIAAFSSQLCKKTQSQRSQIDGEYDSYVPDFLKDYGPGFCSEWNPHIPEFREHDKSPSETETVSDIPEFLIDPEWTPSVVEIRREVDEIYRQQYVFLKLKKRRAALSHDRQTPEETTELALLRSKMFDLEHWLALRGTPIKNGSFVSLPVDDDDDSEYALYADADRPTQEVAEGMGDVLMLDERGLFDDAELERPIANNAEREEMVWTEEYYQAHLARCEARVVRWLDEMPDEADFGLPLETISHTEGLEEFPEVRFNDSISCRVPARPIAYRRQFQLDIRRGAWAVELEHEILKTAERIKEESPWILPLQDITGSSGSVSAHRT